MSYKLPDIRNADVFGKRVFLLSDLDVPLVGETIEDDTRLVAGLPMIKYLLEQGANVVMAGKLGRPEGMNYAARSRNKQLSLQPVAQWLYQQFKMHNAKFIMQEKKLDRFDGWQILEKLFLLENLRFHPEEEGNNPSFATKLASFSDVFVDDAFALSHRSHASNVGVAQLLPHYAGIRLQEEVSVLASVLESPKRPLIVIIGGEKIETKLPLVLKILDFSDYVLLGGKIAQEIGEINPKLTIAKTNENGEDITDESIEEFKKIITIAKTIVWNGPLGRTANKDSQRGTREIAKAIIGSGAYTIVGGGDTVGFLRKIGLLDRFSFISTGGGAMLAFLSGEKLPALEVLGN